MALETDTLNTYGNITGCPTNPPPPVGYRRSKMSSLLSRKSTAWGDFFSRFKSVYKT